MASIIHIIGKALLVILGCLFTICLLRMVILSTEQPQHVQQVPSINTDFIQADDHLIGRLQNAVQFQTISYTDYSRSNKSELIRFREFLSKEYPLIHSSVLVSLEVINEYSLLYTVKGSSSQLTPYLLCAHLDVVPVEESMWSVPPFQGIEDDGFIYGRGTMDDKQSVLGILEALEFRLKQKDLPKRSLYIAFGHDEEIGGNKGAHYIAEHLKQKGVTEVEFLLDEGTMILHGIVPFLNKPVAMVSIAEKGSVTVELTMDSAPTGHSSIPPKETNIGALARAICRLEGCPLPSQFGSDVDKAMYQTLSVEMPVAVRFFVTNLWLFGPLLSWFISRNPETDSLIRTTTAVTMFNGGIKTNVIAPNAKAIVNHRIHPLQSVQEILELDKKIVNDKRIKFNILGESFEPSRQSPYDESAFGYQLISTSIKQVFGQVVVVPATLMANTDTRHYSNLTQNIYRFCPTEVTRKDLARFHGNDERISILNYRKTVNFYYHVMLNADVVSLKGTHDHSHEL